MAKSNHIVFTTVNHPIMLDALYENIARHGRLGSVKVWVVGDRKTPKSIRGLCDAVSARGLEVRYLDIDDQDRVGREFADFYGRLPFNNETRRNIGYLCAFADGCDRLISIDDDNFPTAGDFIGAHEVTGSHWEGPLLGDSSSFHNLCQYIEFEPSRVVYPRGYPFRLRGVPSNVWQGESASARIGVTAGLWLKEPDIDATTWLNGAVSGIRVRGPRTTVLDQSTWTPINTQNTSIVRELIPAYLCVPMGWDVPGGKIQRYGDIWGGYFLQALIAGLEYHVAFGDPIVEHRRNPHDYIDDLRCEFWGMVLTDWLVGILREKFRPSSLRVIDRVFELAAFLVEEATPALPNWCPPEMVEFMRWTAGNLRAWGIACADLDRAVVSGAQERTCG